MYNLTLKGAKGAEHPLKTNVPIDSKTSGHIFMRFGIKILSVWAGVMGYASFDWGGAKESNTPLTMYIPT